MRDALVDRKHELKRLLLRVPALMSPSASRARRTRFAIGPIRKWQAMRNYSSEIAGVSLPRAGIRVSWRVLMSKARLSTPPGTASILNADTAEHGKIRASPCCGRLSACQKNEQKPIKRSGKQPNWKRRHLGV